MLKDDDCMVLWGEVGLWGAGSAAQFKNVDDFPFSAADPVDQVTASRTDLLHHRSSIIPDRDWRKRKLSRHDGTRCPRHQAAQSSRPPYWELFPGSP